MENRKQKKSGSNRKTRSSDLPVDFTKMVEGVYATNFQDGLDALEKHTRAKGIFRASGKIYPDEIVLSVSLAIQGQLAATTVYCSVDFDPKASSPTAEDLLALAVDAIGGFYENFLDPKNPKALEQLAAGTLGAMDDVPFEWAKFDFGGKWVYLMVDKANPELDTAADEWLAKNDPNGGMDDEELERASEDLFFRGPKGAKNEDFDDEE